MAVQTGLKDFSGTIGTGGTAQGLLYAASRQYVLIHNPDTAENLTISLAAGAGGSSGTAVIGAAGTITLFPGGTIVFEDQFLPSNAYSIIAATTGHKFTCWAA